MRGVEAKPDDGKLRGGIVESRSVYSRTACIPLRFLYVLCLLGYSEKNVSVLRDRATVIAANARTLSKAYYPAGLALLPLDRPDEALDMCGRGGGGSGRCRVRDAACAGRGVMHREGAEGRRAERKCAAGGGGK
jgi:hypothetical protein